MLEVVATLITGAALASSGELILADDNIRLLDLGEPVAGSELAQGNPVIARMPRGHTQVEISAEAATRLIRARIPNAQVALRFDDSITLKLPPQSSPLPARQCAMASRAIDEGEAIHSGNTVIAECRLEGRAPLVRYDNGLGAITASEAIAEGTDLGPISPPRSEVIAKRAEATLRTGSGNVTIHRSITTLQTGHEGRNVFVQSNDGQVFAVPVAKLLEENQQ